MTLVANSSSSPKPLPSGPCCVMPTAKHPWSHVYRHAFFPHHDKPTPSEAVCQDNFSSFRLFLSHCITAARMIPNTQPFPCWSPFLPGPSPACLLFKAFPQSHCLLKKSIFSAACLTSRPTTDFLLLLLLLLSWSPQHSCSVG